MSLSFSLESIEPPLSDLQRKIFLDRYALPSDDEQVSKMWSRVAHAAADNDSEYVQFVDMLRDFRYVPGGRILSAMGNPGQAVTSMNCYVLPFAEDSRHGIMDRVREWVDIQATGGGVGINISSLRPNGAPVLGVNGTSSGPVTWAQLFAYISHDVIIQGGTRRGAAMIMMNDHHPDIEEFIHAKETPGKLEGANVSVCISDAFMDAVRAGTDWDYWWCEDIAEPDHMWNVRAVKEGSTNQPCCQVGRRVSARWLWHQICESAWASGEPGVYFMDRANDQANSGYFEQLISSNPCAEQPLGPYGACLLGSLNLMAFHDRDNEFNWDLFRATVRAAVRFNDNVIDRSSYPTEECREAETSIRRMGIGVMGLADLLIAMSIRYGSTEAITLTETIFTQLALTAYKASVVLGADRGAFKRYGGHRFWNRPFAKKMKVAGVTADAIRNCYLISQAPTGTISLLAGVNSGIEPFFDFSTIRIDRTGTSQITNKDFAAARVFDRDGPFVIASDISPEEHVLMQAAVQRWCDSAVSKTVNAPHDATVESVEQLYTLAYNSGLKSIAYYRDGSRTEQVLYHTPVEPPATPEATISDLDSNMNSNEMVFATSVYGYRETYNADPYLVTPPMIPHNQVMVWGTRRPLPDTCLSRRHKFTIDGVEGYIHTGEYDDGSLGEFFISFSKAGSTIAGLVDNDAMAWSHALQYGMPVEALVRKLKGTRFEPHGLTRSSAIPTATSIMDYIGKWIEQTYLGAAPAVRSDPPSPMEEVLPVLPPEQQLPEQRDGGVCPDCGTMLHHAEGCIACSNCGWNRCG